MIKDYINQIKNNYLKMNQKDKDYQDAILANIEVHSRLAGEYHKNEPHFRPESIARVTEIVQEIVTEINPQKVLDLGCGTGFMINILKQFVPNITGVDVTQAMMDLVDLSGKAKIELINSDTGTVKLDAESYDMATAYTFLDHLHDMTPTFVNTYSALRKGGKFYADLSPNYFFWEAFKSLDSKKTYTPEVTRELNAVLSKDEEIEKEFGIKKETFRMAEYQKHIKGGLNEDEVRTQLLSIGFSKVDFIYHWYVGQAFIVNNPGASREENVQKAQLTHDALINMLPLSRHLFKYVGFIATK
jgi:ubiquinone/menaquinone biosynthesis C-methylase UbiE